MKVLFANGERIVVANKGSPQSQLQQKVAHVLNLSAFKILFFDIETVFDLCHQHIAAPPVLNGFAGIPQPLVGVFELL